MHVDGFRFDLASVLGREEGMFRNSASFFDAISQDPVLQRVKLIAEPWDARWDGHVLGCFPPGWTEWNDAYRRTVRRFWRGNGQHLGELAKRMAGSSDIFSRSGRNACASLNYVTSHDGFVLRDLVSYGSKRNEANGQGNNDGANDNDSCNWGIEGQTDDPAILEIRRRMQRNLLATLLLSRGVPMMVAGDEIGNTQSGNNNAYCQDNEVSWINWKLDAEQRRLLTFVQNLSALRRRFAPVRSCAFFRGGIFCRCGLKDVTWLRRDGVEMRREDWDAPFGETLGILLHSHSGGARGLRDDGVTVIIVIHRGAERIEFPLPSWVGGRRWVCRLDTASCDGVGNENVGRMLSVQPRAVVLYENLRK